MIWFYYYSGCLNILVRLFGVRNKNVDGYDYVYLGGLLGICFKDRFLIIFLCNKGKRGECC